MNEFQKELVTALRSGTYKQARRKLRDGNSYCCLGVACDLVDNTKWDRDSYLGKSIFGDEMVGYMSMPPENINELLGGIDVACELSQMNDDGKTFGEIADYMEERFSEQP